MKVAILTSALCLFSGLVSSRAVPAAEAEASPSVLEARFTVVYTAAPSLMIPIKEESPNTAYGPTTLPVVQRINGGKNIQTLLQYSFPAGYGGKSCRFSFANPQTATGSLKVQLFTVGGTITNYNTYWSRPYRDQYKGTFNTGKGTAEAIWDEVSPPTWPCPSVATTYNYEVVPQGDNDYASWYVGSLVMQVYY